MDQIIKNTFAQIVREQRRERKLSRGELSAKTGVSYTTIARIERGWPSVSRKRMWMLASYFGYPHVYALQRAVQLSGSPRKPSWIRRMLMKMGMIR